MTARCNAFKANPFVDPWRNNAQLTVGETRFKDLVKYCFFDADWNDESCSFFDQTSFNPISKRQVKSRQTKNKYLRQCRQLKSDAKKSSEFHEHPFINPDSGRRVSPVGPKFKQLEQQYGRLYIDNDAVMNTCNAWHQLDKTGQVTNPFTLRTLKHVRRALKTSLDKFCDEFDSLPIQDTTRRADHYHHSPLIQQGPSEDQPAYGGGLEEDHFNPRPMRTDEEMYDFVYRFLIFDETFLPVTAKAMATSERSQIEVDAEWDTILAELTNDSWYQEEPDCLHLDLRIDLINKTIKHYFTMISNLANTQNMAERQQYFQQYNQKIMRLQQASQKSTLLKINNLKHSLLE